MKDISRVGVRAKLAPRREPYWLRISEGRSLGFRRLTKDSLGSWLARRYDGAKYVQKPLGDLAQAPEAKRFAEAKRAAEEWFAHLDGGGAVRAGTVLAACELYVAKLRRERSEAAACDAAGFVRRLVETDPIGAVELTKLKPADVIAWRERRLAIDMPRSFNRNLTPLRAALNAAHDQMLVASDNAWRVALRPLKVDPGEGRREIYLTRDERRRLIEKASAEFKPLLTAWCLLPVRPGDIPKVRVADLNVRERALRVPQGKTQARTIPLTSAALEHFRACAAHKLPGALLVARGDGNPWDRHSWGGALKAAVEAAGLPQAVVAYSIRHSVITDLVTGGLDIFTVAKLAGTSVQMIDLHYGKLRAEHARAALEGLSI